MKISALVVQDRSDTWFKGQRDERHVRILTLLDSDLDNPMPNTFDYRLSDDEAKIVPAGSLNMKPVTVSVRAITPAKAGRLVFAGAFVLPNGAKPPGVK